MKKIIFFVGSFLIGLLQLHANTDSTFTHIKSPYMGNVISEHITQLNGQLQVKVWYKSIDTVRIDKVPKLNLPRGWNATFENLTETALYPGDSTNWLVNISYPVSNLPFYPQEISIKQFANQKISPDRRDTVYNEINITAMVYFTPYNTVEIWSLSDFQNLNRKWQYPEDNPNAQRIYVNPNDIPQSNLNDYSINWDEGNWEDDWKDDYREVKVDGLAYSVLMKPVPPDSMEYYNAIGDGADSLIAGKGKTFSGRVIGRLVAQYEDDYGNTFTFPLSGIRVKLMEKDKLWNQTFATGYTDINGNFDLSYSENQMFEGNLVELFLRFKSRTSDKYKIRSTNFIGSHYTHDGSVWQAPQNGGTMNQGDFSMVGDAKYYYDAFRSVHWGNKGYIYFENNNTPLGKKLRFNINAVGSFYLPYNFVATVNLTDDDANHENTPYHEFGHHTMFRLQNNNFTMPYGEQGFSHSWNQENTSRLAWVEGWANFIQMVLDAAWHDEDGEYGYDETMDRFERRRHYSQPISWNITNGYRSEYYFACALYDLWDGPGKGLPTTMPHQSYHGWNETGQGANSWATIDDVEFDFNTLCQPLIQHPSGSGKIRNTQKYINYLTDIVNDCEDIADISRTMQENRVQWNAHEYQWGWHNTTYKTDDIGLQEAYHEFPSTYPSYWDYYQVNAYNKNTSNDYYVNSGSNNTHCITDDLYLGIWDTFSSVYRDTDLFLNNINNNGQSHRTFNTHGMNRIYIRNGTMFLGGNSTTAELNIGSQSLLVNRHHGTIDISDGSSLVVKEGGTLFLGANSTTNIAGSGQIIIENGGYICIEPGAIIHLAASNSYIVFNDEALIGTNPDLEVNLSSNCQMPGDINHTGNGDIIYNCFAFYDNFTHDNVVNVTGVYNWSAKNYKFRKDIIIHSQSKLVVKNNSELQFAKDARIIVKPGGRLEVENSTLTNLAYCDETWPGIEIWGNSSQHQYTDANGNYLQGYVKLSNDAIIENAICALELWSPGYWGTQGGMVYATDATFRNNAKSLHALYYSNFHPNFPGNEMDYRSNFKNCVFEITSDYLGEVKFYKHVDLANVKGIDFQGCDFSLAANAPNVSEWNHGIASYGSKFSATAYCTSMMYPCPENAYDKCTFTGFYSGIHALNQNDRPVSIRVNRAEFTNNAYGVYIKEVGNSSVLFSEFNVGANNSSDKGTCSGAPGVGIYNEAATGFAFEENHFTKYSGAPTGNYKGISINSTEGSNEIYKNYFDGLSYANHSVGKNWYDNDVFIGLSYFCNENENNYSDFYVGKISNIGGIQSEQGNQTNVASNTFSQNNNTWHFYNDGNHLVGYYYNQNSSIKEPNDNKIYHVTKEGRNVSNSCPSHYGINAEREKILLSEEEKVAAELEYYNNYTNYNNVKTLYEDLKDGGNTEGELRDIESARPEDMWELRAQLLGHSPHLSMEVLKEVSDKTEVFTDAAIFDILAANPDELKKESLISYLENKEKPLPDYMIQILRQVSTGSTYKTVLQQEMGRYQQKYSRAAHDIIRSNLADSLTNYTELRNWLDNLGGIAADRQIIATFMAEDNFDDAFRLANMLPQLYRLEKDALTEHFDYMKMLDFYRKLKLENRNTMQLKASEIDNLELIASNNSGIASVQAQNILEGLYGYHFYDCPNLDERVAYKTSGIDLNNLSKARGMSIEVSPNPARDYVVFEYTLPVDLSNATLFIYDVTGKTIEQISINHNKGQKLWDSRSLENGAYTYILKADGFTQSGKLVISK